MDTAAFHHVRSFCGPQPPIAAGTARDGQTVFESGTIGEVRFRFAEPTAFAGTFTTNALLTYRILGATEVNGASALLLEPVRLEPLR